MGLSAGQAFLLVPLFVDTAADLHSVANDALDSRIAEMIKQGFVEHEDSVLVLSDERPASGVPASRGDPRSSCHTAGRRLVARGTSRAHARGATLG
jgi:hypothetical protein